MGDLIWIGALGMLPVVGAPVLSHPTFRRLGAAARVVLSAAAGAVIASFAMTLFTLAHVRWGVGSVTAVALALAFGLRAALPAPPPPVIAPKRSADARRSPEEVLVASVSALGVAAAFFATLAAAATSPDLFFFWGPKAQQFAAARGVDTAYLAEPAHAYMHAYYPPLVVNLGALASIAAGRFSWTSATLTFPILLVALAAALPGILREGAGRFRSAAVSALAVTALAVVGIRASVAGNGDMPLVFFETLAVALLLRRDAGDAAIQLLAGVLLAGAAAAKVEGLVVAAAVPLLFIALRRKAHPAGAAAASAARLLGPTAATLGAWFAVGATTGLFHDYSEYGAFFALHPEYARTVATALPVALGHTGLGLPYLVPLAALLLAGRPAREGWLPLSAAACLIVFLVFAYLHHIRDPSLWIAWSAARVLMPVPALLALALAAGALPRAEAGGPPQEAPSPR
jgi:hypothetical protein